MNKLQVIQNKIYEIRGQKVMLDYDLADLYGVETAQLKRAVRRNINRFDGEDFMFELTKEEISRCQIGTLNGGRGSNFKYLPFAFTELGVAMLSSVLRSETAIEINRGIMRAFVTIRQMITDNSPIKRLSTLEKNFNELKQDLEEIFADYNDINEDTRAQIEAINNSIAELQTKHKTLPRRPIGFIKPKE
ncbi:MAG: ORF6N domain-containing protein [Muribaculaceae bacterium]|nr:ORF6N domain-containing protein [Muribaculaceae bacterium]